MTDLKKRPPGRPKAPDSTGRSTLVQFRLGSIWPEVIARATESRGRGAVMRRDLSRYYGIVRHELATMKIKPDDMAKVCEFFEHESELRGTGSAEMLAAVLTSAVASCGARSMQGLTLAQSVAVMDLIQRAKDPSEAVELLALARK